MTKKQREVANFYESQHISDNLDESVKDKAKRLIDAMEDKSSFINAKFAVGYRLDRMKHADESSRKP